MYGLAGCGLTSSLGRKDINVAQASEGHPVRGSPTLLFGIASPSSFSSQDLAQAFCSPAEWWCLEVRCAHLCGRAHLCPVPGTELRKSVTNGCTVE